MCLQGGRRHGNGSGNARQQGAPRPRNVKDDSET